MNFNKRNKRWLVQIDRMIDGKRIRINRMMPAGCTEAEASAIEQKMIHSLTMHTSLAGSNPEWFSYVESLEKGVNTWIDQALYKCDYRSRQKKGGMTLSRQNLVTLMYCSMGHCAVTGLKFSDKKVDGMKVRPFMHSIDRIDSNKDYTMDNVRIVCSAVNISMMHWGEDLFFKMAIGIVLKRYGMCLPNLNLAS